MGFGDYLGERHRVQSVLGGNLQTDLASALRVPGSLGAGLNLRVDLVVVCSREDTQVVGSSDGSDVLRSRVSNCGRVVGDRSLLNIVASGSTSQETILSDDCVDIGGGTLEKIEESAAVEVGLLKVEVELCALCLGSGKEGAQDLGLQTLCNGVIQLNLGVKSVDSVPALSDGSACAAIEHG